VNDLIVASGEPVLSPLFLQTGHLEIEEAAAVVKGIAEGCRQSNGLIGGETADAPPCYAPGDYDLAGFSVGAVHQDRILPSGICAGDVLGLTSSVAYTAMASVLCKACREAGG
jgi:phosphoribosylaminoimidazole (AIR) synthetase